MKKLFKNYTCYIAPDIDQLDVVVERGFAESFEGSIHSGFTGDSYSDDYWNENEVEL